MNRIGLPEIAQLFTDARTHFKWQKRPIPHTLLEDLYNLVKMAPTSANCLPARFVFIESTESKEKLKPCLLESNIEKTMTAPITVIVAYDLNFHEHLPRLFPHTDAKSWFEGNDTLIRDTAFRNSSLQGAYLIMAARALGLDCGPMSGFDSDKLNQTFFANTNLKANFLINLGYGDASALFPRSPRLNFDEACKIV